MALIVILSLCLGAALGFFPTRFIYKRWLRYTIVFFAILTAMMGGFLLGLLLGAEFQGAENFKLRAAGQSLWISLLGLGFGVLMGRRQRRKSVNTD